MAIVQMACGAVFAAALLAVLWVLYQEDVGRIADDAAWIKFHEALWDESGHGRDP